MTFQEYCTRLRERTDILQSISGTLQESVERTDDIARLQHEIAQLTLQINAHPDGFNLLRMWIVEVFTTAPISNAAVQQRMKELTLKYPEWSEKDISLAPEDVDDWLQQIDPLFTQVRACVTQLGLSPTTVAGGAFGWTIAVYANETDSRTLCKALHAQFADYIDTDVLYVTRKFWKVSQPETPMYTFKHVTDTHFKPQSEDFLRRKASPMIKKTTAMKVSSAIRLLIGVFFLLLPLPFPIVGITVLPKPAEHAYFTKFHLPWLLYQVVLTYALICLYTYVMTGGEFPATWW